MNNSTYKEKVEECVEYLRKMLPRTPRTIIQLGTGLGGFAEKVQAEITIPYAKIPHFPLSTVSSHHGNLILGHIGDHVVAVLQGRVHYYEGYSTREVAFPVRVLSRLGVENLIFTNAAGGLNPLFTPGSIMVIRDHLNFLGENPLRGPNIDDWGPRFPDLSEPYHPGMIKTAFDSAGRCTLKNVISGVYACIAGPSLETAAETRWLRQAGADAVGMSSIPEALVAVHAGLKVLGLSVISNINNPDMFKPILLEDIIEIAGKVEPRLEKLIIDILANI
jgi:purine-nucleoside phosphorylase